MPDGSLMSQGAGHTAIPQVEQSPDELPGLGRVSRESILTAPAPSIYNCPYRAVGNPAKEKLELCFSDPRLRAECHPPSHRTGMASVLSGMHLLPLPSQNPGLCGHLPHQS